MMVFHIENEMIHQCNMTNYLHEKVRHNTQHYHGFSICVAGTELKSIFLFK